MANRILAAIERSKAHLATVDEETKKKSHKNLDMDFEEFCRFQELKSALMGTVLTLDEAQTIYGYLGETPSHFNKQPLEVKVVLTKAFAELIGAL